MINESFEDIFSFPDFAERAFGFAMELLDVERRRVRKAVHL